MSKNAFFNCKNYKALRPHWSPAAGGPVSITTPILPYYHKFFCQYCCHKFFWNCTNFV